MIESKIKVCYNCKKYIRIFHNNPISQKFEKLFDKKHSKHMTQIIRDDELLDKYEFEKY